VLSLVLPLVLSLVLPLPPVPLHSSHRNDYPRDWQSGNADREGANRLRVTSQPEQPPHAE